MKKWKVAKDAAAHRTIGGDSDTRVTVPDLGDLGPPDSVENNKPEWEISKSQWEGMRDGCTGDWGQVSATDERANAELYFDLGAEGMADHYMVIA
ncbi:MAG: hypothetical protein MAG453_01356 [Calditrichaeota bacterium]|nr:hypothetical protein [Calditrichota bacterium]